MEACSFIENTYYGRTQKLFFVRQPINIVSAPCKVVNPILALTEPNRTVKLWFNGLLVPKKINGLVWFGFSINGSVSVQFGSKTQV